MAGEPALPTMIRTLLFLHLLAAVILSSCDRPSVEPFIGGPTSLGEVPAVRLSYRYEADVPPPEIAAIQVEEVNAAVAADFQENRPDELLDRTLTSPDKRRVLAIYHQIDDLPAEFRLDMYSPDGQLIRKMTADNMAVHFPDTIVWSPDSANLAFVAMIRGAQGERPERPQDTASDADPKPTTEPMTEPAEGGGDPPVIEGATPDNTQPAEPATATTPTPPIGVLAFRTEQIYLTDADGGTLKLLTQNEGLIYFYYKWAPDSSALLALAATAREWQFLEDRAEKAGEIFVPRGRPRIVEKNGRERRLDDGLTYVKPVWSPDSTKIAAAFEHQIRIYDADGSPPTQAAVPLRNQLLLSSQAFEKQQEQALGELKADDTVPPTVATLPDAQSLVSFNPIVGLEWQTDDAIYFQTAFVKRMVVEADSVISFARWHRTLLSPQG